MEKTGRTQPRALDTGPGDDQLADKSIIDFHEGGKRPSFRIQDAQTVTADYADVFTPDGRIMTRMTLGRKAIIGKLADNPTLATAAQIYWYKRSGAGRRAVQIEAPTRDVDRWERREMIGAGLAWRGGRVNTATGQGHDVYKGENILAGDLFGEPDHKDAHVEAADDLGLFRLRTILPTKMYAVAQIERCPNAVAFDPAKIAFTNTATLFVPRADLMGLPFDLLFVSRVYRYFFALAGRMSYLDMMRSHVYPRNLRLLPWNEALALTARPLEALRPAFNAACASAFRTQEAMFDELGGLPLRAFRDVARGGSGRVEWSESFRRAAEKIEVSASPQLHRGDEGWRLQVSPYLYDWVMISDEEAARGLHAALAARPGLGIDREALLDMPVPSDAAARTDHAAIVARYGGTDHMAAIEAQVDRIDALVGPALGLDAADLASIRADMLTDPFLKNIVPRWPGSSTRLHGYRTGLDSSERYA